MNNKIRNLLIAFCLIFYSIYADGIPVDINGKMEGEFVAIKLNSVQLEKIGKSRILIFDKKQLSLLRKNNPDFPTAIYIRTPFYQDSTCELSTYGIWNKKNQVCIPIGELSREKEKIDILTIEKMPKLKIIDSALININAKGQMFLNGKLISIKNVKKIAESLIKKKEYKKSLYFNLPPKIDKKVDNKIEKLLKNISEFSKKCEVEVFTTG